MTIKEMSTSSLEKFLLEGEGHLVNVLNCKNYESAHIPGDINIPYLAGGEDFKKRVEGKIPNNSKPLVVYCWNSHCKTAEKAAEYLDTTGYNVSLYSEGVTGWILSGKYAIGDEVELIRSEKIDSSSCKL